MSKKTVENNSLDSIFQHITKNPIFVTESNEYEKNYFRTGNDHYFIGMYSR